jgi:hypothetical protein
MIKIYDSSVGRANGHDVVIKEKGSNSAYVYFDGVEVRGVTHYEIIRDVDGTRKISFVISPRSIRIEDDCPPKQEQERKA